MNPISHYVNCLDNGFYEVIDNRTRKVVASDIPSREMAHTIRKLYMEVGQ